MQHIIKRQILEFGVDKKQNPFHIQNHVSQYFWKQVVPALEKVFDELCPENQIIQFDKMVIDLGELDQESILSGKDMPGLFNKVLLQVKAAIISQQAKTTGKPVNTAAAQWLYYMQHGYLNWNMLHVNGEWYHKVIEELATDYVSVTALRRLIVSNPAAVQRIILQHNEAYLQNLVEILTTEKQSMLRPFIDELVLLIVFIYEASKSKFSPEYPVRTKIWEKIFLLASHERKAVSAIPFNQRLINAFVGERSAGGLFPVVMEKIKLPLPILRGLIETEREDKHKHHPEVEDGVISNLRQIVEKIFETPGTPENVLTEPDNDGIYLQYAGLILLHPFLATFFSRLKFTREGAFANRHSHMRALHILYYMATGLSDPHEYELAMPKLLLAYPNEDTVSREITLNEEELEESDHLLRVAIEKWTILKGTSVAGLREGFLHRNGKYYIKNEKHFLQVESASIDMLLDHLPWNLSMVKLPWMKYLLRVEWR